MLLKLARDELAFLHEHIASMRCTSCGGPLDVKVLGGQ